MPPAKVVLITGASSGLGRAAAEALARRGYRVFGTSRRASTESRPYEMLCLDVRSDESVRACVDEVVRRTGRIDVLVNNAGYGLVSLAEETTLEQARRQFETNFFGAARMVRAVLPVMRRQLAGRIINIGSIAGLLGIPGQSYYCATKWALEGFTESLLYELERFGIEVCVVEPGFFRTEIAEHVEEGAEPLPAYDALRSAVRTALLGAFERSLPPERFARRLVQIVESRYLRLRYPVTDGPPWIAWLKPLVPMELFSRCVRRWFRIGRWKWRPHLERGRRALRRQSECA